MKKRDTGRFETKTQTKIKTEHGTVLKITWYVLDAQIEEYRIRPMCHVCGGCVDCLCFNEDNCDDPFNEALDNLQKEWTCVKDTCVIEDWKARDPDYYQELIEKHGGNIKSIASDIRDDLSEIDQGAFCGF